MPSYWTRKANFNAASRVPERRSRSADSRRAAKLHCRLARDQDSSLTERSAEQARKGSHYNGNADTTSAGDEDPDFQSLDDNIDGAKTEVACPDVKVLQYKVENERLKELFRSRTHELREECSALSICQTELAEALISQTADDNCVKGRQINKLARHLKDRLCHSEIQIKLLREERDQAVLDLTTLSGKMTTCTTIAEEQAKLLKGQLDTIRKFEKKIQILEKTMKEMRVGNRQTVLHFESSMQDMKVKQQEKIQDHENGIRDLQVKHKEEIQLLEKNMYDMRAGYKQKQAALDEQLGLHQQRAALQDRKIQKYRHGLDVAKSELLKGRTREAEMEDHLRDQAKLCQTTTKELSAATTEIEQLKNVSLELHEQEERMEQLWVDNARLMQLLAESDEYQNLFNDMQGGKGLVYCPSNLKTSRLQSLAERYGAQSSYGHINPKAERNHWIPAELYDLVMAFRKQHCFGLDFEVIQELLRIVGAFWLGRHRKILYELKLNYDKQLADLKRQLSQRLPYEQVVQAAHPRATSKTAQMKVFKMEAACEEDHHKLQSYVLVEKVVVAMASLARSMNTSPATKRELYSHPDQSGPPRDMELSASPPVRRRSVDEHSGAPYKVRDGADSHRSREGYKQQREVLPKSRERGSRAPWRRPVSYIDGQRSTLATEENPGSDEDEFYPRSGLVRKNHESDGKVCGIASDCHGSLTMQRAGTGQRGQSKHSAREAVRERPQETQKGCLRGFVAGLFQGVDDEGREKLRPPDRIACSQKKNYYLRRTVRSSPESSVDGDPPRPIRRRSATGTGDQDGFKSFSGSSSV